MVGLDDPAKEVSDYSWLADKVTVRQGGRSQLCQVTAMQDPAIQRCRRKNLSSSGSVELHIALFLSQPLPPLSIDKVTASVRPKFGFQDREEIVAVFSNEKKTSASNIS